MYQNKDSEEIKILNVENTMEKVVYMVESNAERKNTSQKRRGII